MNLIQLGKFGECYYYARLAGENSYIMRCLNADLISSDMIIYLDEINSQCFDSPSSLACADFLKYSQHYLESYEKLKKLLLFK